VSPEELAQRLAWLQQWMGREIASRQALLYPQTAWPMPRLIADATVVIDPRNDKEYPSINPNHVEHLGTSGLASRRILAEIIDLYRSSGVHRFFVYLSPGRQASEIELWLNRAGLTKMVELAVLWRAAEEIGTPQSDFEIRLCQPMHTDLLGAVVSDEGDPFGYASGTVDMLGAANFHTLLAMLDEEPAATGSLYVHQNLGYLGNGKTLEPYRRRGAQTALIGARVEMAAGLGCTDVVSETYPFLPSSYHNLLRAGFVDLYSRSIYRWDSA